jgi:hypothetical protein
MMLGGIRMPIVPPAATAPVASRSHEGGIHIL